MVTMNYARETQIVAKEFEKVSSEHHFLEKYVLKTKRSGGDRGNFLITSQIAVCLSHSGISIRWFVIIKVS